MPTLDWIGKDKVVNHHLDVPYRVLERQYSYDASGQHAEDNGSENMVIHGDNLEALKSLLPQYEGRIKCIYIETTMLKMIQALPTEMQVFFYAQKQGCSLKCVQFRKLPLLQARCAG